MSEYRPLSDEELKTEYRELGKLFKEGRLQFDVDKKKNPTLALEQGDYVIELGARQHAVWEVLRSRGITIS
jgi:hypothetical protein